MTETNRLPAGWVWSSPRSVNMIYNEDLDTFVIVPVNHTPEECVRALEVHDKVFYPD